QERYAEVVEAYLKGLEKRAAAKKDLKAVASVASFFVSRVDTLLDPKLAKARARAQRLLWASTSTKNPAYRDVIYVEELIGADTVNTMPPATVDAFRDHGAGRFSLEENVLEAAQQWAALPKLGVDLPKIMAALEDDG